MKRAAQDILDILYGEAIALSAVTLRGVALALVACETVHKVLVQLMAV